MPSPKRALLPFVAIASLLGGLALALPVKPAVASAGEKSCAQAVVDDWYGNSKVDRRYPLHCYREAIASLSPDQKDYLHAEEDILRALAYARRGKPDPGVGSSSATTEDGPSSTTTPSDDRPVHPQREDGTEDGTSDTVAADELAPEEAASVPLPLILLGGLALVLLAAGGVGVVSRRFGGTPDGDDF